MPERPAGGYRFSRIGRIPRAAGQPKINFFGPLAQAQPGVLTMQQSRAIEDPIDIALVATPATSINALFEAITAESPNRIAAHYAGEQISYDELNARANQLAHHLIGLGARPESMIGCYCERSIELVVALLGIIKAGAAYVPLDPEYPADRLAFMLEDTAPIAIVTTTAMLQNYPLPSGDLPTVILDRDLSNVEAQNPSVASGPTSAAYVMYTSGSTGRPKGVVTEHQAIIRLVRDTNFCTFSPSDAWLHYAPLAFDASTLEIWGPLLNGGRLVIAPPKASLEELGRVIRENGVTAAWLTTGLFNLMVDERAEDLVSLRQFLTGGDVVSPIHLQKARAALPDCTLINGYGPTENTTFTCCHVMRPGDDIPDPVPIGLPISNTTAYILNADLQPVTPGETGELYAGGLGVARGYLNNRAATEEKFLPDPFSNVPGARMYRTGDLARQGPDGIYEFFGRADHQVKILGHRIEPGEIESVISTHEGVSQACILVHTDKAGTKRLIAYYVAHDPELSPGDLRTYLASKLPRYMMPGLIVPLCALPLNANGKVDRGALPQPQFDDFEPIPRLKPGASVEDIILAIWQRALSTNAITVNDNFFDVGGNSLKLVSVHAELEKHLGRQIPILDLFEHTNIRALADHLSGITRQAQTTDTSSNRGARQRQAFAARRGRRKSAS